MARMEGARLVDELRIHQAELRIQNEELRQARDALEAEKERYADLYEFAPVGYLTLDRQGGILKVNLTGAGLLGGVRGDQVGKPLRRYMAESGHQTVHDFLRNVYQGGAKTTCEVELRRVGLPSAFVSLEGVLAADGNSCLAIMADVTARKQAQDALEKAKEQAEAANKSKSTFLANMSHEIRTPLNGILGMLQLMQLTALDMEQAGYIDMARRAGQRLNRLLADILDLSRMEADRLIIESKPFALPEAMKAVEQMFLPIAEQAGLRLEWYVDPSIPHLLCGDTVRLQQVLSNLVGNALKFTLAGGVHIEAYPLPGSRTDQHRVLFSVADTGKGISEDQLSTLFQPFSQVEGGFTRTHQGAGLGLTICKRLVTLMGGSMAVDSEPGAGSTFFFCITFGRHGLPPEGQEAACAQETPVPPTAVYRILLAEDDQTSRISSRKLMESAGHSVLAVEDGQQALETLRQVPFDLVLMDVQMPVLGGVEATRAIRAGEAGADRAGVPIVAITAYAMTGDREKFLAAGMDDYIAKPVYMNELVEVLTRVMGRRG
jgi:PAS domain S-box-containing protein